MAGNIEGTGRRGRRRRKQLLDNITRTRKCLKLKEEALDFNRWRIRFGGYGPVVKTMSSEDDDDDDDDYDDDDDDDDVPGVLVGIQYGLLY
jgi:hypothetical protein